MGTPYPDLHAFVLSLAVLVQLLEGLRMPCGWGRTLVLAAVPATAAAALLSKQVPTLYVLPLAALIPLAVPPKARRGVIKPLLAGLAFTVLALGIYVAAVRPDLRLAYQCLYSLPAQEGARRMARWTKPRLLAKNWAILMDAGLISIPVAGVAGLFSTARGLQRWRSLARTGDPALVAALLAASLTLLSVFYILTCYQTAGNNCAYVFLAVILAVVSYRGEAVPAGEGTGQTRHGARVIQLAVALLAVLDGITFHLRTNETHVVSRKTRAPVSAEPLDVPGFYSLDWSLPRTPGRPIYRATAGDVRQLIQFLKAQSDNFFLIGDESILYAATGKPSPNPALWFHEGLVYPIPPSPDFPAFEDRLLRSLRRNHVGWVVVDGEHTWSNTYLWDFPRLAQLCHPQAGPYSQIGPFAIYRLEGLPAVADASHGAR